MPGYRKDTQVVCCDRQNRYEEDARVRGPARAGRPGGLRAGGGVARRRAGGDDRPCQPWRAGCWTGVDQWGRVDMVTAGDRHLEGRRPIGRHKRGVQRCRLHHGARRVQAGHRRLRRFRDPVRGAGRQQLRPEARTALRLHARHGGRHDVHVQPAHRHPSGDEPAAVRRDHHGHLHRPGQDMERP